MGLKSVSETEQQTAEGALEMCVISRQSSVFFALQYFLEQSTTPHKLVERAIVRIEV